MSHLFQQLILVTSISYYKIISVVNTELPVSSCFSNYIFPTSMRYVKAVLWHEGMRELSCICDHSEMPVARHSTPLREELWVINDGKWSMKFQVTPHVLSMWNGLKLQELFINVCDPHLRSALLVANNTEPRVGQQFEWMWVLINSRSCRGRGYNTGNLGDSQSVMRQSCGKTLPIKYQWDLSARNWWNFHWNFHEIFIEVPQAQIGSSDLHKTKWLWDTQSSLQLINFTLWQNNSLGRLKIVKECHTKLPPISCVLRGLMSLAHGTGHSADRPAAIRGITASQGHPLAYISMG